MNQIETYQSQTQKKEGWTDRLFDQTLLFQVEVYIKVLWKNSAKVQFQVWTYQKSYLEMGYQNYDLIHFLLLILLD